MKLDVVVVCDRPIRPSLDVVVSVDSRVTKDRFSDWLRETGISLFLSEYDFSGYKNLSEEEVHGMSSQGIMALAAHCGCPVSFSASKEDYARMVYLWIKHRDECTC